MFFFTLLAVTASVTSAGQLPGYPAHASCKADWWVMRSQILGFKRAEGVIYDIGIGKPRGYVFMCLRVYLQSLVKLDHGYLIFFDCADRLYYDTYYRFQLRGDPFFIDIS